MKSVTSPSRVRLFRTPLLLPLCLCLLASTSPGAITSTAINNGNGTYTYTYTIDNLAGSSPVGLFSLEFDFVPDWNPLDTLAGGDVSVPNSDWIAESGVPLTGVAAQDFIASPQADVPVGSTQSGFSFTSTKAPGTSIWRIFDLFGGGSTSGTTTGPSASGGGPHDVPEGGIGWLGCGLLVGLLALTQLRKTPGVKHGA